MKKQLITLCMMSACVLGQKAMPNPLKVRGLAPDDGIYFQEDFSGDALPAGMFKVAGGGTATVEDGKLHISKATGNTVISLPASLKTLRNYTIECSYTLGAVNDNRRFGAIWYRCEYDDADVFQNKFYLMNFRKDGSTARGACKGNVFTSDFSVANVGAVDPSKYYNLKIVVEEDVAKHYYDGNLVQTADLTSYDSHIGKNLQTGGIAIVANGAEMFVDSIVVSENKHTPTQNYVTETYQAETPLALTPSVFTKIEDETDYESLKTKASEKTERPTGAIVTLNDALEVVNASGSKIATIDDVFNDFNRCVIPLFHVASEVAATKLGTYLKEAECADAYVVTDNMDLNQKVKQTYPLVSSLYIVPDTFEITKDNLYQLVCEANTKQVKVLLVPDTFTKSDIAYLQKHIMTVWGYGNNASQVKETTLKGVNGIVGDDVSLVYETFNSFKENTMTREPLLIGHRGKSSMSSYENTMSAFIEAYEDGADVLEMDLHVTSDKRIVIQHDDNINGTKIANMTLQEVQQAKLTKNGNEYHIPTMDEVFEYFQDKDVMLALEIKITNVELISLLKAIFETTYPGIAEKCFFIGFYDKVTMFGEVRKLLPYMSIEVFPPMGVTVQSAIELATKMNAGLNPDKNIIPENFVLDMQDRGYMVNLYTYASNQAEFVDDYCSSIFGLTTDFTNWASNFVKGFAIEDLKIPVGEANASYVSLDMKTVKGESVKVYNFIVEDENFVSLGDGRIYAKEAGTYNVRISYTFHINSTYAYTLYSDVVTLQAKNVSQPIDPFLS